MKNWLTERENDFLVFFNSNKNKFENIKINGIEMFYLKEDDTNIYIQVCGSGSRKLSIKGKTYEEFLPFQEKYVEKITELMKKLNSDQRLIDLDEYHQIKSEAPEYIDEYFDKNIDNL